MAKKKAPAKPKGKTSEKVKKSASPRSNVRVRPEVAKKTQPQKEYNKYQTWKTEQAASGNAARQEAKAVKAKNDGDTLRGKSKRVIKIRTGGGMGGMFGTKNR
jgi:hypothetical protein